MIVTVLYPAKDGARFDFDYYKTHHAPMVDEVWKPQSAEILKGVACAGGSAPPYLLSASFRFASPEALQAAMADPRGAELMADVAKFTDITPSVVVMADL